MQVVKRLVDKLSANDINAEEFVEGFFFVYMSIRLISHIINGQMNFNRTIFVLKH